MPRYPLHRIWEENIGAMSNLHFSSNIEELFELMASDPNDRQWWEFEPQIIRAASVRFKLDELLDYATKHNKLEILQNHLKSNPEKHQPAERGEIPKEQAPMLSLTKDGGTVSSEIEYHAEKNWFLNAWCRSKFVPGYLPLLKDYPWFEELWT